MKERNDPTHETGDLVRRSSIALHSWMLQNRLFGRSTIETDELFIYLPPTVVKTVETFSGYQRELSIPLTHPSPTTVNFPVSSSAKC